MADKDTSRSGKLFFYAVLAVALLAGVLLIGRFWQIIAMAAVVAIIARPLYVRFERRLKGREGLAVGLTILTVFVVVLIPGWIIITMTIGQATEFAGDISVWLQQQRSPESAFIGPVNQVLARIPGLSELQITGASLARSLQSLALSVAGWLAGQIASLGGSLAILIIQVVLFITLLSALLPGWPALVGYLKRLSPLPDRFNQMYVDRIETSIRALALASLLSLTLQATTMTFFLWLAGVRYLFFWFLICLALSMLPIGCSLIAFPVGGFLLLTGQTWQGLIIILGYVFVTANVSPVVVPMVTGKRIQVSPALTALSLYGGLAVLGLPGVLYGPIIMILILTTLEIYLQHVKKDDGVPTLAESEGGG